MLRLVSVYVYIQPAVQNIIRAKASSFLREPEMKVVIMGGTGLIGRNLGNQAPVGPR